MMKVTLTHTPERRDWTLLAGVGLLVPAVLALLRVFVLRHSILGGLGTGFAPLAGPLDGIWPHSFYPIMHDLTHPLPLFAYAAALAWLPFHLSATASGRQRTLLFLGILLMHFAFLFCYFGSLFLPVGDMVTTMKP